MGQCKEVQASVECSWTMIDRVTGQELVATTQVDQNMITIEVHLGGPLLHIICNGEWLPHGLSEKDCSKLQTLDECTILNKCSPVPGCFNTALPQHTPIVEAC